MPPKRRSTRQRVSEEEEDAPEILVNGSSSTSVQQQDHLILHDAPREGSPSTAQVFLDQQDAGSDIPTALEKLKLFLVTAPSAWQPGQVIKRLRLPTKDTIACVLWNNLYHITGTDIVKALQFRFAAFGRPVKTHLHKKFEEGVFSDLRNLKPGVDATLEDPRSPLLDFLFKSNCIRTQKKQKVFYWFSVPHDRLFLDALERDLKRESQGLEPTTMPNGAMSADVTLNLAKQQCLPTFAVDASNPTTPNVFSRQGSVNSGIDQQLHQQYQDATALQQEYIQQALSAAASAANSPFIDAINPFQQQAFIPSASPHIQQHRLSPLQMSQQFPSQSPSIQHSSPESPNKRQRLEVPSSSTSPQHQSIKVTAPMSLLEGSPNFKQRSRSRVQASPGIANQAMNPDNFRSKDDKRHFVCNAPNCGQSFKRFEHLRRHFRLHTGEKPYHCQHNGCERSFARVDGLSSHLKTHGLSPAEITAAVRKQQEAAGDRHDGNTTEEEGDVPELVNEGPGESPMALLTPLSMMANAHAQQQGMHMFQQSVMMQNSMPPNAYQHHMEQLSAQAEMMHQQQQVGGEQFSTFFNIESPTSLNLPDASAFMPDGSQQKPFFTFQVPTHQFSADATYSMTNYPQARYGYDASSSQ